MRTLSQLFASRNCCSSRLATMGERVRSLSTNSSGSSRLFGGSIRLNDLREAEISDEYGFNETDDILTDEVEEAHEATTVMPDDHFIPAGGEISDSDSQQLDRSSMGSNDSKDQNKLSALIDKAKSKGRKLVSKKEKKTTGTAVDEASQCTLVDTLIVPRFEKPIEEDRLSLNPIECNDGSSFFSLPLLSLPRRRTNMPFFQYRMMILGLLIALTLAFPGFLTGVLWGFFIAFVGFLYFFVSDPKPSGKSHGKHHTLEDFAEDHVPVDSAAEASSLVGDHAGDGLGVGEGIVYRGWMNELKCVYSPLDYHVNNAQSVLVRLEGSTLRISRPAKAVLKHAFHEDPTLSHSQPTMVAQTIYDLTNAQVSLRPKRLARRRWWSRKYPIHIRFANRNSELVDVDMTRPGMTRSVTLHPTGSVPDKFPTMSEIQRGHTIDEGYSAESESSSDDEVPSSEMAPVANQRIGRASSTNDIVDYHSKPAQQRKIKGRSIYLFVRAAREKERWFHLLREACAQARGGALQRRCSDSHLPPLPTGKADKSNKCSDQNSNVTFPKVLLNLALEYGMYKQNHRSFTEQMASVMGCGVSCPERGSTVSVDLGTMKWRAGVPEENSDLVESINAIATRIFFDFCRDGFWANQVKQKMQSKLATIHLPFFIEKLELTELDLGTIAPKILGVYSPKSDEWGLWMDLEMKYEGGIRLVLQTSLNLIKLKSGVHQVEAERKVSRLAEFEANKPTRYSDSDLPESPESSPDEDFGAKNNLEGTTKERTGKKIISMVERAAQSSLFQKAAKISKVAKIIEDISSMPLTLNVEVTMLAGIMTFNIPPPPSDRLWYGFRKTPDIGLRAIPQLGDRSVDVSAVSEWIESRLRLLIEKNLVCPNMDDIILPVMSGNPLLHMRYNH